MTARNKILPKAGLILGYKHFYSDLPVVKRIDLIKHISKTDLIFELAACNYRIKSPKKIFFEYPTSKQVNEIQINLRFHPSLATETIEKYQAHLRTTSPNSIVFNRASLIYAINEIINTTEIVDIKDFKFSGYDQEKIFKYLLLINDEITLYKSDSNLNTNFTEVEKLNLALLPLNEYFIPIDPILVFFRGGSLFNYLNSTNYRDSLNDYIQGMTGLEPQRFILELTSMFMTKHMGNEEHNLYYHLQENDERIKLFEFLSDRIKFAKENKLELLGLKKSPLYKTHDSNYFLLDNMFLLQKSYDFFIWDFLNDKLLISSTDKDSRRKVIQNFKSEIGYFFQKYIRDILENSFKHKKFKIKAFDELIIKINKKEIELGDIYVRCYNKILIGEAKTTSLINDEKYAEDLNEFYNNKPDKFFEKHGLFQLVVSIKNLLEYGKIFDNGFPTKRIEIYPILVFNDLLLNIPLFNQVFNDKFKQLVSEITDKCVKIHPLTLVHISDLEILEYSLGSNKLDFFKLLDEYNKKHALKIPFYRTTNKVSYRNYSERFIDYYKKLINKFNGQK